MRIPFCFILAAGAMACSSAPRASSAPSTVEGKLDIATFALRAPTGVDAIDEASVRTHVALAPDGMFRLALTKGHAYRLVALTPRGEEPLVFPRSSGHLDRTFRISSGAAIVRLGSVRHFDRAPATFSASDDTTTSCESGGQAADNTSDGECENGKDSRTGLACTDAEGNDAADPAQPMAVPEKNPPSDVAGCEDGANDGETDD